MKSIFCFIAILVAFAASPQQTASQSIPLKDDLLKKSNTQKKTARIMLGSGIVLIAAAFIIPDGESKGTEWGLYGPMETYANDGIQAACALVGVLSSLGSIPFFIASSKNKKKAMSLSFKNEMALQLYQNSWVQKPLPALSFKLSL